MAAQLSVGYLHEKVKSTEMYPSWYILFDGNDTQFLGKVDQKICIEDILRIPITVNIGGNYLALSLETHGAHGREKAFDLPLVGSGSVSLKDRSVSL
jgi:hypothetical protein